MENPSREREGFLLFLAHLFYFIYILPGNLILAAVKSKWFSDPYCHFSSPPPPLPNYLYTFESAEQLFDPLSQRQKEKNVKVSLKRSPLLYCRPSTLSWLIYMKRRPPESFSTPTAPITNREKPLSLAHIDNRKIFSLFFTFPQQLTLISASQQQ